MQSETTERRRDSDNGKRSVSGGRRFDKDLRESPFGSTGNPGTLSIYFRDLSFPFHNAFQLLEVKRISLEPFLNLDL